MEIDNPESPHHEVEPAKGVNRVMESIVRWSGRIAAWTIVVTMLLIVAQVLIGNLGTGGGTLLTKLMELQWHLYAVAIIIGMGYAYLAENDTHVRVDLLHHNFSPKKKAIVEICGILLFVFPFFGYLGWISIESVTKAFEIAERSDAPGGLTNRWIIRAFLPLGCGLAIVAAITRLLRSIQTLRGAA